MRTSPSQFELIVSFMERYGDLSKQAEGAQGRVRNIQLWAKLSKLLNADATGEQKTHVKWRKVWSDFKNNTKRKMALSRKDPNGEGGSIKHLTELEQRVLNIVAHQSTNVLDGADAIFEDKADIQRIHTSTPSSHDSCYENGNQSSLQEDTKNDPLFQMGSSSFKPTTTSSPREGHRSMPNNKTASEMVISAFLSSDRKWRIYEMRKERQERELQRERLRLRELELQQRAEEQRRWQELFGEFLTVMNRAVDVFDKK